MRLEVVTVKFFSWGVQAGPVALDFSARDPSDKSKIKPDDRKPGAWIIASKP